MGSPRLSTYQKKLIDDATSLGTDEAAELYARGDAASRHRLIESMSRLAAASARKFSNTDTEYEEFLSEAFLEIIRLVDLWNPAISSLYHYVKTHLDFFLFRKVKEVRSSTCELDFDFPNREESSPDGPTLLDIERLLRHETPENQRILKLRYGLGGYSPHTPTQISKLVGLPISTVDSRIKAIIKRLSLEGRCRRCGNPFHRKNPKVLYCSKRCSRGKAFTSYPQRRTCDCGKRFFVQANQANKTRCGRGCQGQLRPCKLCKKPFRGRKVQLFCSRTCSTIHRWGNEHHRVCCQRCGKEIKGERRGKRERRYCSLKCANGRYLGKERSERIERPCEFCKKKMRLRYGLRKQRFCSQPCKSRFQYRER